MRETAAAITKGVRPSCRDAVAVVLGWTHRAKAEDKRVDSPAWRRLHGEPATCSGRGT